MKKILALACFLLCSAVFPLWAQVHFLQDDLGWRVVADADSSLVLAFGDGLLDEANLPAPLIYMMECYCHATQTQGTEALARNRVKRKADFSNIGTMVNSHWAQGSPYYNQCPMYDGGGSRCVTGCVATAMAQVLYFHKLPRTMRGSKTYGYTNKNGHRVTHSFNFGATTFDWDSMRDSYSLVSSNASKAAVAQLMYACGVATNMDYSPNESGANPWVGADGINCFMDGLRAEYQAFTSEAVLAELKAGRPVIFSGTSATSGGGHCFVIDGARSDGYFHCNLGWGGSGDGYYLPTDMSGYSKSQMIVRVWPSSERETCTPMQELRGKYAKASWQAATQLVPGQWYAMWNAGRAGSPKSNGIGKQITNTSMLPTGESTVYNANQLVRLVQRSNGGFYIQTGVGDYWGSFPMWSPGNATASGSAYFNVASIKPGYWSVSCNSTCYLDTNGPGGTVVGWGNTAPTDTVSNSSWRFYPVTISDEDITPGAPPSFDPDATYTLRNTGYSQGYLVATSASDAHPTLRGVTTDHANGLYSGALYHDAPDFYSDGPFWRITTDNGLQYLQNTLTGKYLANKGDKTCYEFTAERRPIYISRVGEGSVYTFNSGSQAESFLCAATNLANPAAYWTASDEGSLWTVEKAEKQALYEPVKSVALQETDCTLFSGRTLQLHATVNPSNATNPALTWTTSNAAVATVTAQGLVTAVGAGTASVSATSLDNSAAKASLDVRVLKATVVPSMGDFSASAFYTLHNTGYSQGYLVVTSSSDTHPTLRGVTTPHPTQGCIDDAYMEAPDLLSLNTYWQILSEGTERYLYSPATEKYLTNEGDRTSYVLTAEPTPINVSLMKAGVFRFNSGTDSNSYLCAATHLENPAAYWTAIDTGSEWTVEAVEGLGFVPTRSLLPSEEHPSFAPLHDLQGRAVSSATEVKGIYIRRGQKYLKH